MAVRAASIAAGMATGGAPRRFRGSRISPLWQRPEEVGVIVLPLVVEGDHERRRLELLFGAVHSLRRALQHDVRHRLGAWRAGHRRARRDPAGWLGELGLSREALEHRAYRCLERSGWLLHHLTKALAMHVANEIWVAVERHLFRDRQGRRSGIPRVTGYWDLGRIPGRARSHTAQRKWETFRLFGTLQGHLDAHRHPELPDEIATPAQAASLPPGRSVLAQRWRMRPPERPASWWDHEGPLVLVWNGGARSRAGELVLPVRLPQGSGRWPHLVHYLAEPERWHKVDLVRRRDASAVGGWTYQAHLMVLGAGYQSPGTRARREVAAGLGRIGGVDGNVSRLAVVSITASPEAGEAASTIVELSEEERARLACERRQDRARQRALDRSRRAANARQYRLSRRQQRRAERRSAAGLRPRQVSMPAGARESDSQGRPRQAFRRDALSRGHRRLRARHAEAAASLQKARTDRARRTAATIVAAHGPRLTIEETDVRLWFRRWGRACAAFTPGRLIQALEHECTASGGALTRVSTHRTALSQHCLCGARVPKTLSQRIHTCPECGLRGDRDLVSAALAAFTILERPGDPRSASVDYEHARRALGAPDQRLKAAVAESTALRPLVGAAAARPRRASARRHAGPCLVPTPVGSIASPPGSHARKPDSRAGPCGPSWKSASCTLLRVDKTSLAALLRADVEAGSTPGVAVAVRRGDGPVELVIEGRDGAGRPLTADSLYPVASLTKLAMALAVLRLADAGGPKPEDELASHLPDAAAAVPGMTVRHLLTHTGGLPTDLSETEVVYREASWPVLAAACLRCAPERPPGTGFEYGNVGYGLLGILVERLTGQRVGAALAALVLEPLGIEGYLGDEPPRTPAVVAGVGGGSAGTAFEALNTAFWRSLSMPWGGLVTTAPGALALVRAFADSTGFLRPETRALATSDQSRGLPTAAGTAYEFMGGPWGLGPELHGTKPYWAPPEAGPDSFGHVGSSGCVAWAAPSAGVAWAALSSQALGGPDHWLFARAAAVGRAVLNGW